MSNPRHAMNLLSAVSREEHTHTTQAWKRGCIKETREPVP